jgi:hypothetical protein
MSRVVAAGVFASTLIGAAFVACGGNSSPAKMDAKTFLDAKVFMDAPGGSGSQAMGLGEPCTPGSGAQPSQGTCPTGFSCLALSGGNGMWCSKTCVQGSGDTCNQGYGGPGIGACVYGITFGSGTAPMDFCGIICEGSGIGCPSTTCNGMCPGTLQCTAGLQGSGSATVAHACR